MSGWEQKEKVIKEQRTSMAVSRNLMGPAGKIGIILKAFGNPIMSENSGMYDVNYLDDSFGDDVDTKFESTASGQNGPVTWRDEILDNSEGAGDCIGYVFDGLSRGIHIEIQTRKYEHSLTVHYKGYEVYKEVAGELESYAPATEWEDVINRLYKNAKIKQEQMKEEDYIDMKKLLDRKKETFWERLKSRWGI